MSEMLSYTEAADRMGISVAGVKQLITELKLLSVRTEQGLVVPAASLDGTLPVKSMSSICSSTPRSFAISFSISTS